MANEATVDQQQLISTLSEAFNATTKISALQRDVIRSQLNTIKVGEEQRLGLLAAADDLASAPIGDPAALRDRLNLEAVLGALASLDKLSEAEVGDAAKLRKSLGIIEALGAMDELTLQRIVDAEGKGATPAEIAEAVSESADYKENRENFVTKVEAAGLSDQSLRKFYVNQTQLNEGLYDHFGIMDKTIEGAPYLLYRRGVTHATDAGKSVMRTLKADGTWTDARTILSDPELDYRDPAGGTLPSGRMVLAALVRNVNTAGYNSVVINTSDDNGQTWIERRIIGLDGFEYKFIWGKLMIAEGRVMIPAYYSDGNGGYQLRLIVSSDNGETWDEGPTIYSGATYYNETAVQYLGGGHAVAVSRVAGGSGGRLRVWKSTDAGATWVDDGDMKTPEGDASDTLVSPSMSYVVTAKGEPVVLLFYGNRTAGAVMMRSITIRDLINGGLWSQSRRIINLEKRLGYQTQITYGNRLLLNSFTEPSSSLAYPVLTEVSLPDIGQLTSGWTSFSPVNGWSKYTDGSYQRDTAYRIVGDLVELRGVVKNGPVGSTTSQAVIILPEGFRPLIRTMNISFCQGGLARVDAHPSGAITVSSASDVAYVSLDNIRFSKT